ncbi:MAG: protein serine/threonine phosphatase [Bacteroidetes bacterium]|nr:protein serine/threonine phosphatase [Bacteroidota bacterium]
MKRIIVLVLTLGILFPTASFAQNRKIDSLNTILKNSTEDTIGVKALLELSREYRLENEISKAQNSAQQALDLSKKLDFKKGIIRSYSALGRGAYFNDNYPKALEYHLKALKIAEETGDRIDIAASYQRIGEMYALEGNEDKSLDYTNKALAMYQELDDLKNMAVQHHSLASVYDLMGKPELVEKHFLEGIRLAASANDDRYVGILYEQLGNFYITRKNYQKALEYHKLSLGVSRKLKDDKGVADSYSDLGNIYLAENKFKEALENNLLALDLYMRCADPATIAQSNMIVGQIYMDLDQPVKALEHHLSALQITEQLPDSDVLTADIYFSLSNVFVHTGEPDKAVMYLKKTVMLAKKLKNERILGMSYQRLTELALKTQDYKSAYEFQKLRTSLSDSVYESKEEEFQQVQQLQEHFEEEKKENERQLHLSQIAQKELALKQESTLRYALIIGLILILVFAGFIYNRFKLTQRQKETITLQKELVENKRKEAEAQKQIIEEKQKEIIESISYAKRLQEAILPPQEFVSKHLPGNFILYRPKDLVAGDFYFMEVVDGKVYIAAADSTGHGVPGAMVSVVCSNALNRAVKEFGETETGRILDKTRELVLETFEKSESEVKDGMDISLLCIDKTNEQVYWSGANNPLWYVSAVADMAVAELVEVKANKQPIGKTDNPKPFTTHKIGYIPGTAFYLFTDGYADQFGGDDQLIRQAGGKKFKHKQLKEFLLANQTLPLEKQSESLDQKFKAWKGNLEQVDDVCIIGIRL